MNSFKLSIDLGNDGMRTQHDVAEALIGIAKRMRRSEADEPHDAGRVYDINGNSVGSWQYDHEPDDEPEDLADECSRCGAAPHEPCQDCPGDK